MPPQTTKSLLKEFRASFRKKKNPSQKIDKAKELEEEELAKLVEFKETYGENIPSRYKDADLLAFVKARSLNVKEAIKLFKIDMNMFKMLEIESLIKDYDVSDLSKNFRISNVIGFDKEGSLVRVINLGVCDVRGNIHAMSTIEHFKTFMWFLEHDRMLCEKENLKTGKKDTNIMYILNYANLNMSHFWFKPIFDTGCVALKLLQDHYQAILKIVFFVNVPAMFPTVLKMFKPFIQESLHQKLKIFGSDGYKEELLKHIDADVLPAYLGGNRVDNNNDPCCSEILGLGGEIPRSFYPTHFLDEKEDGVVVTTVPAGSTLSYRYRVPQEGCIITYRIQSKDNDLGICVYLDKGDFEIKQKLNEDVSKLEQLCPVVRSQCHICPEWGGFETWFSGTIVFYLDNTYSWMSSKVAVFKITVEPPSSISNKPMHLNHIRPDVMVLINK